MARCGLTAPCYLTWRELAIYYDELDRTRAAERAFLGACSLGDTGLADKLNPYAGSFISLADWIGQAGKKNNDTNEVLD